MQETSMAEILLETDKLQGGDFELAWSQYKPLLLNLSRNKKVLEIGAGRSPLFSLDEIQGNDIQYVANDISTAELDQIGWPCEKLHFDICDTVPEEAIGQSDVIFSKMVLEHVIKGEDYYRNLLKLLKVGGVALTLHPTLFASPFVLNLLLPEALSAPLLKAFFPYRNQDVAPKFPAHYSLCYSTERNRKRLKEIGFSEIKIYPFYGHKYFNKIPVLRSLSRYLAKYCHKWDIRLFSSYAYTITIK